MCHRPPLAGCMRPLNLSEGCQPVCDHSMHWTNRIGKGHLAPEPSTTEHKSWSLPHRPRTPNRMIVGYRVIMYLGCKYSEIVWLRAARTASTRHDAMMITGLPNTYLGFGSGDLLAATAGLAPGWGVAAAECAEGQERGSAADHHSLMTECRQAGHDHLVLVFLFEHQPQRYPFGHSLTRGRPQKIWREPASALGAGHFRDAKASATDNVP
jgi:hypothetical protein